MDERIRAVMKESVRLKQVLLADARLLQTIEQATQLCIQTFQSGGKVLWCGNGGSAADAQHLAAELSGRFYVDREPLFSEALHVNGSYVTAVANDYSYDEIFARMVRAAGRPGDVLIGLSTSGNSPNVIKALETAQKIGMHTIGMTGETGGKLRDLCDFLISVPSQDTPRIQECHMLIGHLMCELIERSLFEI
jgi:D-sedoheptulose 7-phosphate isomerase